jgi:DNA-binding MarR family transcriptional regulator
VNRNFNELNKVFESRIRLGIMAMLMVEDSIDYNSLKAALEVTDGNLASHVKALEAAEYISVEKSFFGRKPHTRYRITTLGKLEFEKHIHSLEALLKNLK